MNSRSRKLRNNWVHSTLTKFPNHWCASSCPLRKVNQITLVLNSHYWESKTMIITIILTYLAWLDLKEVTAIHCPTNQFDSLNIFISKWSSSQRSKLTFSKSHLLETFYCKMVALKKFSRQKKNLKRRTLHDILHGGVMRRTAHF